MMKSRTISRWLVLILISISLPSLAAQHLITQRFVSKPYQAIMVEGPINLLINGDKSQPDITLIGDVVTVNQVKLSVKDGVLNLSMSPNFQANPNSQLTVNVNIPSIHSLQTKGSGQISAKNLSGAFNLISNSSGSINLDGKNLDLHNLVVTGSSPIHIKGIKSQALSIQESGTNTVNLDGIIALQKLDFNSSGTLNIYWVDSKNLKFTGTGTGKISLAGIVGTLEGTLSDKAQLDAKYLQANRGIIHTTDNAHADVWVKNNLTTIARGNSSIYYFNDPEFLGGYMRPPAVVLRMVNVKNPA